MDKQPVKRGRGPPEGHCLRKGGHQGSAEKPVLGAVLLQTPTPGPGRGERWGHGFGREHHAAEGTSPGRPRDRDARGQQPGRGAALGFEDSRAHRDEDPDFTSKTWVLGTARSPRLPRAAQPPSDTCNSTEEEQHGTRQRASLRHSIKSTLYPPTPRSSSRRKRDTKSFQRRICEPEEEAAEGGRLPVCDPISRAPRRSVTKSIFQEERWGTSG